MNSRLSGHCYAFTFSLLLKRYLSCDGEVSDLTSHACVVPENEWTYWDEKISPEDLDEMWRHPQVKKEWISSNEKRGQVRFARDAEQRPYLTTTELKVRGCINVGPFISAVLENLIYLFLHYIFSLLLDVL